ncbi:hypothetical protein CYY_007185 [Polysphondylium violaceum]|uniref:EGF-like domain-containing protein n=1 Tax=Polysphondylium violaceum TaxID=133409 RepID=A0A8J4UXU3_9MYCE|nr:hypothetical protein CYY_007185 [Polysphondylium violaceum]
MIKIFFFCFCLIVFVHSLKISVVLEKEENNLYANSLSQCTKGYLVLFSEIASPITSIDHSCISTTTLNQTIDSSNLLYNFEFQNSIGAQSCEITLITQLETVGYTFNFICQEMPIPIIKDIGSLPQYTQKFGTFSFNILYEYMFSIENVPEPNSQLSINYLVNDTNWSLGLSKINYNTYIIEIYPIYSANTIFQTTVVKVTLNFQNNYEHFFEIELKNPKSNIEMTDYNLAPIDNPVMAYQVLGSFNIKSDTPSKLIFGFEISNMMLFCLNYPIYGNPFNSTYFIRLYLGMDFNQNLDWVNYQGNVKQILTSKNINIIAIPPIDDSPGDIKSKVSDPNPALGGNRILSYLTTNTKFERESYSFLNMVIEDQVYLDPNLQYLNDGAFSLIGNFSAFNRSVDMIVSKYYNRENIWFGILSAISRNDYIDPSSIDLLPPIINDWELIALPGFGEYILLRASITDNISGFAAIYEPNPSSTAIIMSCQNLVSGTIQNGVYEVVIKNPLFSIQEFYISDYASNTNTYGSKFLPIMEPFVNLNFSNPRNYNYDSLDFQVLNANWSHNDIDLSLRSCSVIFSFTLANPDKEMSPCFQLGLEYPFIEIKIFCGTWNETSNQYEILVTLPMRMLTGVLSYSLFYYKHISSDYLNLAFPSSELRIFSQDADMLGPEIIDLSPIDGEIGWTFRVYDKLNGFASGNITITGSLYQIENVFILNPNDEIHEIRVPLLSPCVPQTYTITSAFLVDNGGYVSDIVNVFKNYINVDLHKIEITCPAPIPLDPPILKSFEFNPQTIDVGSNNRNVTIKFTVEAPIGNALIDRTPFVYLTSLYTITKKEATFKSSSNFEYFYECEMEVPYGFGAPEKSIFSLYGIMDITATMIGFTSSDLDRLHFDYILDTTEFTKDAHPVIESSSDITVRGGKLLIIGNAFGSDIGTLVVNVVYNDGIIDPKHAIFLSPTSIVIENVRPTTLPFKIQIAKLGTNSETLYSNDYWIKPRLVPGFPYTDSSSTSSIGSSTSDSSVDSSSHSASFGSDSSSNEIIPTNPPNPCINSCGGPTQGRCASNGCVCISPWVGADCTSKVIIIPTPSINNSLPTTNFSFPSENNAENIGLTGIISIVELQELDKNDQILFRYPFAQWVWTNISTFGTPEKYLYSANITNSNLTTYVNVTIQYFEKQENISFAGEELIMNPYSIKYNINISSYSFTNSQNSLQLIMKLTLESNESDGCSAIEKGNTTLSNSDFVKLQINNHSLYGRFVKRGIIDGRISSISNQVLENYHQDKSTQFNDVISFMGIKIRSFRSMVQLDPDFSVLLDQNGASSSDSTSSICSSKKKKLSVAQLAGIIIGSILFGAVVIVASTYFIYKNLKEKRFEKGFEKKLKNIK